MSKPLSVSKLTSNALSVINKLIEQLNYKCSVKSWDYYFKNHSYILVDDKILVITIELDNNSEYSVNSLHNLSNSIINHLSENDIKISLIDDSVFLFIDHGYSYNEVTTSIKCQFNIDTWALFDTIQERVAVELAEFHEKEKQEQKRKRQEKAEQKKKKEQDERLLLAELMKKYGKSNE